MTKSVLPPLFKAAGAALLAWVVATPAIEKCFHKDFATASVLATGISAIAASGVLWREISRLDLNDPNANTPKLGS
jgi:hypothetical protein